MSTTTPFRTAQRGFTLLMAVILASVLLTVGLALADIAYKQVVLASSGRQSQFAFYAADSATECALYWDQKFNAFAHGKPVRQINCDGAAITPTITGTGDTKVTTFSLACVEGTTATVVVYKTDPNLPNETCGGGDSKTCIYADGYNTCDTGDPRRIERSLKTFF